MTVDSFPTEVDFAMRCVVNYYSDLTVRESEEQTHLITIFHHRDDVSFEHHSVKLFLQTIADSYYEQDRDSPFPDEWTLEHVLAECEGDEEDQRCEVELAHPEIDPVSWPADPEDELDPVFHASYWMRIQAKTFFSDSDQTYTPLVAYTNTFTDRAGISIEGTRTDYPSSRLSYDEETNYHDLSDSEALTFTVILEQTTGFSPDGYCTGIESFSEESLDSDVIRIDEDEGGDDPTDLWTQVQISLQYEWRDECGGIGTTGHVDVEVDLDLAVLNENGSFTDLGSAQYNGTCAHPSCEGDLFHLRLGTGSLPKVDYGTHGETEVAFVSRITPVYRLTFNGVATTYASSGSGPDATAEIEDSVHHLMVL